MSIVDLKDEGSLLHQTDIPAKSNIVSNREYSCVDRTFTNDTQLEEVVAVAWG
jgi:hypothetical protein